MMALGTVCVTAGLTGLLSFVFLTVAIATDYWYVIDVSDSRYNNGEGWEDLNSHSGLWRICEGKNACIALIDPFGEESQSVPESQQHLLFMQKVFVILLPLSLVLLVLGGIGGLISSLANGLYLLLFTGSYFLVGGTVGCENPRRSAILEMLKPPRLAPTIIPWSKSLRSHFFPIQMFGLNNT
ncbi:transmembrane protein 235 isoform X2 [Hypanus sabinus]|uniref:transmembrane protein 235 isoform X2 n=1 Tax=Hypanus sabinus TaxID=79690 RepID=UPI0028C4CF1E|nr:transmembrane protein 235 isoform X2 [Hypanus sabinus]